MDEKGSKAPKRDRYWSIMLVGDHGRVIPFRHFKTIVIGVGLLLGISLAAVVVLSLVYGHQRTKLRELQESLEETRAQTAKFRDEKDLCLTQLIAKKQQSGDLPQAPMAEAGVLQEGGKTDAESNHRAEAQEVKPEEPVVKPEPRVKWSADIRNFKSSYDNRQQILKAEFRIYNTSTPKKALAGRTVVVFKAQEDSPIHWTTVPSVPLKDGKPIGNHGKAFKINNYRTEQFRTIRRNNSAEYDTASVYIFTEQGQLIANQEIALKVDYSPPPPAKPVEPKPDGRQEETSTPADAQIGDGPAHPEGKTTEQAPQSPTGSPATPQSEVTSPSRQQEPQIPPAIPKNDNAQDAVGPLDAKPAPESEKESPTIPIPAAEPKPVLEGGQK